MAVNCGGERGRGGADANQRDRVNERLLERLLDALLRAVTDGRCDVGTHVALDQAVQRQAVPPDEGGHRHNKHQLLRNGGGQAAGTL